MTGLGEAFGLLSSIPFGFYIALTTAPVLSGSYGNSLRLSIQRLLGSLMGVVIVVIFSRGLELPLPLGIGLAMASVRLLGGALGLQVGYKVAGNIVIMGWLVHSAEETTWGFTRLFWTAIGILISLWATRYVWPSTAPLRSAVTLPSKAMRASVTAISRLRSSIWKRRASRSVSISRLIC